MHLIKSLFIILFLIQISEARELQVKNKNLAYKLTIDKTSMKFEAAEISLSLDSKDCNTHIRERFIRKLDRFLSRPFLTQSRDGSIEITLDGIKGHEPKFGKRAEYLLSMNEEFKKIKLEESLSCK